MAQTRLQLHYNTGFLYVIFSVCTAMIGHTIHGSLFWSIMDCIVPVIAWVKWLILHEVNWSIIRETFSFFVS